MRDKRTDEINLGIKILLCFLDPSFDHGDSVEQT